ncbi:MAG: Holliday junction resolvase RuvX [Pseudomonadota bacterium]|jgi:putative Holliday junction resolvase|uniref:Putative pre-16S rRNA nuclease n=2 Tax=Methylophaga TaxID=40222 RepID=F5SYY9_9GAMM|nr:MULTISPECIES: Holliday junction resolvase RuvX [Methylophaga]MEC9413784.1 Holliday junction resolvase RuvX [Pseudomonadota bacterium]EGL54313.1 putative endonuclease involved in recombination [Methylophaga aminisulfidivorans MP]WVI85505.1 Holliday junction resolvase RuvX [Methylophaga thalassica]GLQ00689.1 putative pre-16S rRNA nuclease [Methylophaga thalassica]HIC46090.1 Holliday junction resolvase RuvX [Methylophaga sp.]
MSAARTLLGFDFGMKNIGIAVGQELTATANPLTAIKARDGIPDWSQIEKLLKEWQPDLLIVGLPLNMDGTEQEMTAAAKRFGNRLNGRFNIPVEWQDERLTTYEALDQMGIRSKMDSRQRSDVDQLSAQLILQSWLNQQ